MFSYDQVGAAAMLSRATAGVYRGKDGMFIAAFSIKNLSPVRAVCLYLSRPKCDLNS